MRAGSGRKREKKRKGERMRGIALERIFDFALLQSPGVTSRRFSLYKKRALHLQRSKCIG